MTSQRREVLRNQYQEWIFSFYCELVVSECVFFSFLTKINQFIYLDLSKMDDSVILLTVLTLIDLVPEIVGHTLEDYGTKRACRKLETTQRRKKIRNRVSAEPEKFIGKTLQELNLMGININQADFNRKISSAVNDLTSSKRNCLQFKLFDVPGRKLRSDQNEIEEESELDITFSSATAEIEIIKNEMETRNSVNNIKTQLEDALKINEAQKLEIESLKKENKQLRAELANFTPIRSLFARKKVVGERNATYPIGAMMNRFILLLLVQGQIGSSIHKFLDLLFKEFNECFVGIEQDVEFKLPSLSHINDLRKAISPLCDIQIMEFLAKGKKFVLSSDGTRTNRNAEHLIGIGILNEELEFLSLKNKLTTGENADELALEIVSAIPSNITGKIEAFISDSAHLQLKTQRILNQLLNEISGEEKERSNNICLMHTGEF